MLKPIYLNIIPGATCAYVNIISSVAGASDRTFTINYKRTSSSGGFLLITILEIDFILQRVVNNGYCSKGANSYGYDLLGLTEDTLYDIYVTVSNDTENVNSTTYTITTCTKYNESDLYNITGDRATAENAETKVSEVFSRLVAVGFSKTFINNRTCQFYFDSSWGVPGSAMSTNGTWKSTNSRIASNNSGGRVYVEAIVHELRHWLGCTFAEDTYLQVFDITEATTAYYPISWTATLINNILKVHRLYLSNPNANAAIFKGENNFHEFKSLDCYFLLKALAFQDITVVGDGFPSTND